MSSDKPNQLAQARDKLSGSTDSKRSHRSRHSKSSMDNNAGSSYPFPDCGAKFESPESNADFICSSNEIDKHNRIINELKKQIREKQSKPMKNCITEKEIHCLKCCLEKELNCLKQLMQSTVEKQCMNPSKPWGPIPLSTTLEEDRMPRLMLYAPGSLTKKPSDIIDDKRETATCVQESLLAENLELEDDRLKLQDELANRDKTIECLQQKMQCLQLQLTRLCVDNTCKTDTPKVETKPKPKPCRCGKPPPKCCCTPPKPPPPPEPKCCDPCNGDDDGDKIKDQLDEMSMALNRLQMEISCLQNNRKDSKRRSQSDMYYNPPPAPDTSICSDNMTFEDLRAQHTQLLKEYAKQDNEIQYLKSKLDELCSCTNGKGSSTIRCELELCKKRMKDLQDEEEEFKILISEQQDQLRDYREKYMQAQQKVVEQKFCMENMEMSNKRIEEQINNEVQRIKCRFQEKLKELAPLPRILENEQAKRCEAVRQVEDLENKLSLVCTELKKAKKELKKSQANDAGSWEAKCSKLCMELNNLKQTHEQILCEKICLEKQLSHLQTELDCLRSESARIITRTKERACCSRDEMQKRIDMLEMELAECRANSSLTLADREEVIYQMKSQLGELSTNFDVAQKQIRTLKNRMQLLSDPREPAAPHSCGCGS